MSPTNDPQPGPELDRAIGEALGVKQERWEIWSPDGVEVMLRPSTEQEGIEWLQRMVYSGNSRMQPCRVTKAPAAYPAYSTDGNAMLALIDLMAKRGYWCRTESTDQGCDAWFIRRNGSLPRVSGSDSLPAAIALAAIKALRSEAAR